MMVTKVSRIVKLAYDLIVDRIIGLPGSYSCVSKFGRYAGRKLLLEGFRVKTSLRLQ